MATPSYLRCPPYSTPRPVPGRHDPAAPRGRRYVSSCLTAAAARVTRATTAGKPGALRPVPAFLFAGQRGELRAIVKGGGTAWTCGWRRTTGLRSSGPRSEERRVGKEC